MTRDHLQQQKMLFELGQLITSEINLDKLFTIVVEQTNRIMDTSRCSVLLYDPENEELYALVSTDVNKDQIRFPSNQGVAGWVLQNRAPLIINDPYNDPRFNAGVDRKTGVKTHNMLCIPLINRRKICIGTLQTMNKIDGEFDQTDLELLESASHYIAIALENAKLYHDLKELDRAKEKIINHLSHELKTPLSIILGVLERVRSVLDVNIDSPLQKTISRGERNVQRLIDLQLKIDDILNKKSIEEKEGILNLIHSAASLVDEVYENNDRNNDFVAGLLDRLTGLFSEAEPPAPEPIPVEPFLAETRELTVKNMGRRKIEIVINSSDCRDIFMDRTVLAKIISGLRKNAIENTPDEGRIVINASMQNNNCCIEIQDYGVGITSENKKMIFGGFFHTQDTMAYSSKRPYEFNAGGTGSDLLRIKALSERYGFNIDFTSKRCRHIPQDADQCPGKISRCSFLEDPSECFESGCSTFKLEIPYR